MKKQGEKKHENRVELLVGEEHFRMDGGKKELSEVSAESVIRSEATVAWEGAGLGHSRQREPLCKGSEAGRGLAQVFSSLIMLYSKELLILPHSVFLPAQHCPYIFLKHFCTVGPLLKHVPYSSIHLTIPHLVQLFLPVFHINPPVS